ncbi:MAG: hypothetical protein V7K25_24805 [Nostoc sp.]|uniref:hypothetical protein n=1 Tax=Nostoc sp. TaxID=1180 RepID=UPI002FFBCBBB
MSLLNIWQSPLRNRIPRLIYTAIATRTPQVSQIEKLGYTMTSGEQAIAYQLIRSSSMSHKEFQFLANSKSHLKMTKI